MTNYFMPLSSRSRIAGYLARVRYAGKAARMKSRSVSRVVRRRSRGLRASRLMKYNVHSYKRMASRQDFQITQPATAYNNSFAFTLSDVRNSTELTNLYDQYMITGVKVVFRWLNNPDATQNLTSTTVVNTNNTYPTLFYTRDYDDVGVETTNDLRERNTTKMAVLRPNSTISVFIKPAVRNQLYLDGVTTASSPLWKQWLDCSSSAVPHYGMKFSVDFQGVTINQDCFLRVEKTYYLKFKNAR